MSILIVTFKADPTPNKVIDNILMQKRSVFRLNTDSFLSDYDYFWSTNSIEEGIKLINRVTGASITTSEISSVWFRRAFKPNTTRISLNKELNRHNISEAQGFLEYLYNVLCFKPSIGSYVYDDIANSKILQLEVAKKLGIAIPHTCISNDKEIISTIANKSDFVIIKSIRNDAIKVNDNEQKIFYSQRVSRDELLDLPAEAFVQAPNLIQEYIEKDFELRVTVICDDIFACKIESQAMDDLHGKIDWRQGVEHGMKHEIFDLPEEIAYFCKRYLKHFKLNFGCFDFIVTPDNKYVFLECNPNGQWLWIEGLTGLPISESIARNLIRISFDGNRELL